MFPPFEAGSSVLSQYGAPDEGNETPHGFEAVEFAETREGPIPMPALTFEGARENFRPSRRWSELEVQGPEGEVQGWEVEVQGLEIENLPQGQGALEIRLGPGLMHR